MITSAQKPSARGNLSLPAIWGWLPAALLCLSAVAAAADLYVVGGQEHSWETSGTTPGGVIRIVDDLTTITDDGKPLFVAEPDSLGGWIVPVRVDPNVNISLDILERGGSVDINLSSSQVDQDQLDGIVNGDHKVAFDRKPIDGRAIQNNGIIVTLDLGARFGVNRVLFYPRMTETFPFANDFMRGYELYLNDGLPASLFASGQPNFVSPVSRVPDNSDTVVVTDVDPQFVRFIQLKSIINAGFEIDELEVYGTGFVPEAAYESLPLQMDGASVWGTIHWDERSAGNPDNSAVEVRVRSGSDDSPDAYFREILVGGVRTGLSADDDLGNPLTEASYQRLLRDGRAVIKQGDIDNWSGWQLVSSGQRLSLPAPREYFQFRTDFSNQSLDAARAIANMRFEFDPPPVDGLVAEIEPAQAEIATETTFTYVARADNDSGRDGFERFELETPARVSAIRFVELQDSQFNVIARADFSLADLSNLPVVDGEFALDSVTEDHFALTLPRVRESGTHLKVVFDAAVFRYGTRFQGRAFAAGVDLPLLTRGGDATPELDTDDQLVRVTLGSQIAGGVDVHPPVLTPNADGANDETFIQYSILHLLTPSPVNVSIHDLSGRRVRSLPVEDAISGRFQVGWKGQNDAGQLVPPGVYLVVVEIRSDGGTERSVGQVAVVY
jgi:hypothetical protein